jgi:hypothetical protein
MNLQPESPASHAASTLFEPVTDLLRRFDTPCLPDVATLQALLQEVAPATVTASGKPVRFDAGPAPAEGYEARIHDTGAVPTRANDWHDFFNALSWCVWPRSKAALNAAHVREIDARRANGTAGRGPLRDALTQFDECGLLVVSSDPDIPRLLAAHEWQEVFWNRRDRLAGNTAFLVFGHGSWEQLRNPFAGLCAKTLHRVVAPQWFDLQRRERQRDTDAWLADRIVAGDVLTSTRHLRPLPLLGIPGVTPDNACADYYLDTRQFRPPPEARKPGP